VTFLFFGAVMIGRAVDGIDVETVVYAVLSLTLVRMVPVAVALLGTGARSPTVAFVGWFGPRGLASIVFALTIVDESGLPGTSRVVDVATVTVLLSVVLHGITAPVLTDRYASWLAAHRDGLTGDPSPVDGPTVGSET
jgi:NhaP-type Na+/H+ or K+/H+ antiporter